MKRGSVVTVAIDRPITLLDELTAFDSDTNLTVAVLHGNGWDFCAGYNLKELVHHTASVRLEQDVSKSPAPMLRVPMIDRGTVRLPRLGLSQALDLILTGRPIGSQEAYWVTGRSRP
ncbi:LOW QUALITY PROTEIN: uncharacterized protein ACWYII_035588 [Salvelinus alpinus]